MQLRLLDSAATVRGGPRTRVGDLRLYDGALPVDRGVDRMHFWRPLPRKAVDVICGEGIAMDVPLHAHETLQVLLPTSRFAVVSGAGRTTVVRPGLVHVMGPLEFCTLRSLDGAMFSTRVMLIAPAVLAKLAARRVGGDPRGARPAADSVPNFTELVVDDPSLHAELMAVFDALRRPLVALECESRLLECLGRLVARHTERSRDCAPEAGGRSPEGVVRVRDYLRAHVAENVTLDALTRVAGLSKFYLLRAFHRAYGLTPHAYQMQLRLTRARHLLAEGRPLSYVTYDAGFADQSHLTRRFAAFYGLTPGRYARQLAAPFSAASARPTGVGRTAASPPAA